MGASQDRLNRMRAHKRAKLAPAQDTYQMVTDRIIAKLESGTIPWKHFASSPLGCPKNAISKKAYRGINQMLLGSSAFKSDSWVSFKQALDLGGNVRKGEKGSGIVFWKFNKYEDKNGEEKTVPMLKYYTVFNLDQTEGIEHLDVEETPRVSNPIEAVEAIVANMPKAPKLVIDRVPQAFYSPSEDLVHMTEREGCVSDNAYYSVLLHELAHATGHKSRLDRHLEDGCTHKFGSTSYAKEELVAEISSAMVCSSVDLFQDDLLENTAAYIQSWIQKLKDDPKLLITASGKAQRAADYILGRPAFGEAV